MSFESAALPIDAGLLRGDVARMKIAMNLFGLAAIEPDVNA